MVLVGCWPSCPWTFLDQHVWWNVRCLSAFSSLYDFASFRFFGIQFIRFRSLFVLIQRFFEAYNDVRFTDGAAPWPLAGILNHSVISRLQFVPKLEVGLFAHLQVHFNLWIVAMDTENKQIFLNARIKHTNQPIARCRWRWNSASRFVLRGHLSLAEVFHASSLMGMISTPPIGAHFRTQGHRGWWPVIVLVVNANPITRHLRPFSFGIRPMRRAPSLCRASSLVSLAIQ